MSDTIKFSTSSEQMYKIRSTAGCIEMFEYVLTYVLNIDRDIAKLIASNITESEYLPDVISGIKSMPLEYHRMMTGWIDMGIEDNPPDVEFSQHSDEFTKHNTDEWDPSQSNRHADLQQSLLGSVAYDDMYSSESRGEVGESRKLSLLGFLQERQRPHQIDAQLIAASKESEDGFDEHTKRRIKQYERVGNTQAATRERERALRKKQVSTPTKPMTTTDSMVERRKQQLASALQVQQRAQDKQDEQD